LVKTISGRVLITGGAGFIGSHLVDAVALSEDVEITVLDNLSRGRLDNLRRHLGRQGFRLVRGDVRDRRVVEDLVRESDYVFHLAALVSVQESTRNPKLTNDVNVGGTLNVLEAAMNGDVRRIVYASSCAVYGDPQRLPLPEDCPARPISPYGASKLAAEAYCISFHEAYGLKTVALRFFNVYGPRQTGGPYSGVISIFMRRALSGEPLIIYGDGRQTRDFVYVGDVVEACLLAAVRDSAVGQVINVGTGVETSVLDLAGIIRGLVGDVPVRHGPPLRGDIRRSVADITKARRMLGYNPRTNLSRGILETLEWFKRELEVAKF